MLLSEHLFYCAGAGCVSRIMSKVQLEDDVDDERSGGNGREGHASRETAGNPKL